MKNPIWTWLNLTSAERAALREIELQDREILELAVELGNLRTAASSSLERVDRLSHRADLSIDGHLVLRACRFHIERSEQEIRNAHHTVDHTSRRRAAVDLSTAPKVTA